MKRKKYANLFAYIKKKQYLCTVIVRGREIYTNYDAITKQKELGVWEDTMCLAQRNVTLDFYYRLYSLVLEYTPERGYGYKNMILNGYIPGTKTLIISQMGGGYSTIDFRTINAAIEAMEEECCR